MNDYKTTYNELLGVVEKSFAQTDEAIACAKELATQRDKAMEELRRAQKQVEELLAINKNVIATLRNDREFLSEKNPMAKYAIWLKEKSESSAEDDSVEDNSVCNGCKYFATCGDSTRKMPCNGRE